MFFDSVPVIISYVFCTGVFCALVLKNFLETVIVSRYCLKFFSSKSCSYLMKGAFVKIILASGVGTAAVEARTFLILTAFSFQFQGDT